MARGERGFTLVELVVVMAVGALLVWVALPRAFTTEVRLQAAARQMQSDIRYAQELAMTRGTPHEVRFYSSTNPSPTNRYQIVTAAGLAVRNPLTGDGSYVVDFSAGAFAGVSLDSTLTVQFDSLGRPNAGATISLGGGGKTITVDPETGRVVF